MQQQSSFESQPSGESRAVCDLYSPQSRIAPSIGRVALLFLVRVYIVFLSPFFGGACKFYPSCSNYAREAIERHGAHRGTVLALKRLLRCHPFTRGGIDLVPDELSNSARPPRNAQVHLAASGQGKTQ